VSGAVVSAAREERRAEPRSPGRRGGAAHIRLRRRRTHRRRVPQRHPDRVVRCAAGRSARGGAGGLLCRRPSRHRCARSSCAGPCRPRGARCWRLRLVPGAAPTTVYRGPALTSKAPSAAPARMGHPRAWSLCDSCVLLVRACSSWPWRTAMPRRPPRWSPGSGAWPASSARRRPRMWEATGPVPGYRRHAPSRERARRPSPGGLRSRFSPLRVALAAARASARRIVSATLRRTWARRSRAVLSEISSRRAISAR